MNNLTADMTRLRSEISVMRSKRVEFINDLKQGVVEMQKGFHNTHNEMAGKTRDELMTFVSDLKGDVFQMQEGFRNDLEAARRVWFGFAPEEAKPKTRKVKETRVEAEPEIMVEETRAESEPEVKVEDTRVEAEPEVIEEETVQELIPDDLTEIKGIGSGMQKQLYDGGITTFAQLAECTPDDLRRVLGEKFARLAPNAENWIEQAKELVN